jgi:hypothetical protein
MTHAPVEALVEEQTRRLQALAGAVPITSVVREATTVIVEFQHPRSRRPLAIRFRCDGYPLRPAAVDFVEPETHNDIGASAWPTDGEQALKTTSNPRFICIPGVREYHDHHGQAVPGVHSLSLAGIFHQVLQALEVRG